MTTADDRLPAGDVTFVFTDIEQSTQLYRRHGTVFEEALERHNVLLRTAMRADNGVEVRAEGDGFLFAFGDPAEAVRAACRAQKDLRREPWPLDPAVRVRMGMHVGRATPRGGDYVTFALHVAARVADAAHGGQVLASEEVWQRLGGRWPAGTDGRDLGLYNLHGSDRSHRLFQVAGAEAMPTFPALRAMPAPRHNMSIDPTELIGREAALADLSAAIAAHAFVTVVGTGGAGKTRLAREVARESADGFGGGAWFVELAPLAGAELVLPAIAAVLSVRTETGGRLADALVQRIGDERVLLVIDNCEHVLDAAAEVVRELLQRCPRLVILATSRERLALRGEHTWRIPSLAPEDAAALLRDRIGSSRPSSDWTKADEGALLEIVERVDRIPLALELAASRAHAMSMPELARRLARGFDVLRTNNRGVDDRHQALAATIAWSYELLSPERRVLLRRMSVFAGGCTSAAVEAVCAGDEPGAAGVLDGLTELTESSLVEVTTDGVETRWTMLETIRQFAADRLGEAGETAAMRDAHLAWAIETSRSGYVDMSGPNQGAALRRLDDEHANVLAALGHAHDRPADVLRLAADMTTYWTTRVRPEAGGWLEFALAQADDEPGLLRARALRGLAEIQKQSSSHDEAQRTLELALEEEAGHGPEAVRERVLAMVLLAELRSYESRAGPEAMIARARSLGAEAGDELAVAYADHYLGCILGRWDDRAAIPAFDRCLQAARSLNHARLMAATLPNRAVEAWYMDDLSTALALSREGVEIAREIDDRYALQFALGILGESLGRVGEVVEGRRLVLARLREARDANLPLQAALALEQVAFLACERDAAESAALIGHTTAGYLLRSDEDVARHDLTMAWLAESLGPDRTREAMRRGASWTQEEADAIAESLAAAPGPAAAVPG